MDTIFTQIKGEEDRLEALAKHLGGLLSHRDLLERYNPKYLPALDAEIAPLRAEFLALVQAHGLPERWMHEAQLRWEQEEREAGG